MPGLHTDWTVEMVHALPDDGCRYEVIDGELFVTPAPSVEHQRAVVQLTCLLAPYAETVGLEVLVAPFAITFSQRREVQPDLLAWPVGDVRGFGSSHTPPPMPSFVEPGGLALAVEILSPSTARVDRHRKRALYQSQGVAEYWIVDTANRMVERWRPNDVEPDVLVDAMTWRPAPGCEPLTIDLISYFRHVRRGPHAG